MADNRMLQTVLDKVTSIHVDIKRLEKKVDKNGKRIDNLTASLCYLEDDTPSARDFHRLEKRVDKLEKQGVSS